MFCLFFVLLIVSQRYFFFLFFSFLSIQLCCINCVCSSDYHHCCYQFIIIINIKTYNLKERATHERRGNAGFPHSTPSVTSSLLAPATGLWRVLSVPLPRVGAPLEPAILPVIIQIRVQYLELSYQLLKTVQRRGNALRVRWRDEGRGRSGCLPLQRVFAVAASGMGIIRKVWLYCNGERIHCLQSIKAFISTQWHASKEHAHIQVQNCRPTPTRYYACALQTHMTDTCYGSWEKFLK